MLIFFIRLELKERKKTNKPFCNFFRCSQTILNESEIIRFLHDYDGYFGGDIPMRVHQLQYGFDLSGYYYKAYWNFKDEPNEFYFLIDGYIQSIRHSSSANFKKIADSLDSLFKDSLSHKVPTPTPFYKRLNVSIEEGLKFYYSLLEDFALHSASIKKLIRGSVSRLKEFDIVFNEYKKNRAMLIEMLMLAPFWIQSPRTWNNKGEKSLFEHLFVKFEVPEFLLQY